MEVFAMETLAGFSGNQLAFELEAGSSETPGNPALQPPDFLQGSFAVWPWPLPASLWASAHTHPPLPTLTLRGDLVTREWRDWYVSPGSRAECHDRCPLAKFQSLAPSPSA